MWVSIHNTGLAVQGSSSRCLSRFASRFAWTRGSSARLLGLFAESLGYIWFFDSFLVIIWSTAHRGSFEGRAHPAHTQDAARRAEPPEAEPHLSSHSVHRQSHSTHGHAVMWLRDTFF